MLFISVDDISLCSDLLVQLFQQCSAELQSLLMMTRQPLYNQFNGSGEPGGMSQTLRARPCGRAPEVRHAVLA